MFNLSYPAVKNQIRIKKKYPVVKELMANSHPNGP